MVMLVDALAPDAALLEVHFEASTHFPVDVAHKLYAAYADMPSSASATTMNKPYCHPFHALLRVLLDREDLERPGVAPASPGGAGGAARNEERIVAGAFMLHS